MAITITLTPRPTIGAMVISVTGAPTGPITITRSDDNGLNPVRQMSGQVTTGGALTVLDYEPALTGSITYSTPDGATTATATSSLAGSVTQPWLTIPANPAYRVLFDVVTDYDGARDTEATVHSIIDRADPIVIPGPLRYRTGKIVVHAFTYAVVRAIAALLERGELLQLRQADFPGLDLYFTPTRYRESPRAEVTNPRSWGVEIDYAETAAPVGPLLSAAGWTVADVTATYPTTAAVKAAYVTVAGLTVGP